MQLADYNDYLIFYFYHIFPCFFAVFHHIFLGHYLCCTSPINSCQYSEYLCGNFFLLLNMIGYSELIHTARAIHPTARIHQNRYSILGASAVMKLNEIAIAPDAILDFHRLDLTD